MHQAKILVVDDDPLIVELVQSNLEEAGYKSVAAFSGEEAIRLAGEQRPDLILLDVNMPGINGFEVCRRIRGNADIPVIMLTARKDLGDQIEGLNIGADDYITKPFRKELMLARVNAILRRTGRNQHCLACGGLTIDFLAKSVHFKGRGIKFSPTEYCLLEELAVNAGESLSDEHLLCKVWGREYSGQKEYLHEFIKRLRSKIEPLPHKPVFIITVPGIGYRFQTSSTS